MPNGDLFDLLILGQGKSLLTWKNRVFIAQQLAQVGYYLHSKNIIHRDFKSQNVLVSGFFLFFLFFFFSKLNLWT